MTKKSSALQSDLSEEAARIAVASLTVKARLLEAADTFAHMDVGSLKPGQMRTAWPHYLDDTIGGHSVGYGNNESRFRFRPSAEAISRAEEVMSIWLPRMVAKDEHRIILGRWALCVAVPKLGGSFRGWCKETGRSRSTAERRVVDETKAIARSLLKNAQSLHEPAWSRVVPMLPEWGREKAKLEAGAHGRGIVYSRAPDAKPVPGPPANSELL